MQFSKIALVLAAAASSVSAASISHNHARLHNARRVDHSQGQVIAKRGLTDTALSLLTTMGVKTGTNAESKTSDAWIGDDGDYTNVFENTSDEDVILVLWGSAGSWVAKIEPLITYSLSPNDTVTISFADHTSGAWSGVYPSTAMSTDGQIFNTWGEYTFNDVWSTVDVSREVNMDGNDLTIVTPGCTANMDTCVFVCKDGATSCYQEYELLNCDASNGGGTGTGDMDGGCNGITSGSQLKTYFG